MILPPFFIGLSNQYPIQLVFILVIILYQDEFPHSNKNLYNYDNSSCQKFQQTNDIFVASCFAIPDILLHIQHYSNRNCLMKQTMTAFVVLSNSCLFKSHLCFWGHCSTLYLLIYSLFHPLIFLN